MHPEAFRLFNSGKNKNKEIKLVNNLFFWNNKIPKENKEMLEQIIVQANEMYDSLKPLISLGITFDLWLVGGAVRDLVLGKPFLIKDLDILLTFNQTEKIKIPKPKIFMKKTGFDFNKPQLQSILIRDDKNEPFNHWRIIESKGALYKTKKKIKIAQKVALFDMVACAFGQSFDMYEMYKPITEQEEKIDNSDKYLDLRIEGVIKIKKDNWRWPADILVSTFGIDSFLSAFDFGICKVGMELFRGSDMREQREMIDLSPKELLRKARVTEHFLSDVIGNKLSMSIGEMMTVRQMKHSLEIHLEKLEKKYPWELKIEIADNNSGLLYDDFEDNKKTKDLRVEYLKAFMLKRKLNVELTQPKLEITKKITKI